MRPISTFLAMCLLASLPNAAMGQGKQTESRSILLRLACFRYAGDVKSAKLPGPGGDAPLDIAFYQGGFTPPVEATVTGNSLDLMVERPDGQGGLTYQKIASAAIPDNLREASILLLPAAKGSPLVYDALLLPDSARFPYGHAMLKNLCATSVRFAIGKNVVELAPNGVGFTDPKPAVDAYSMYPVAIAFQAPKSDQWIVIHETLWQWNERVRQIAVAWYDPVARKPEISTLREIQPVATPEKP